VDSEEIEEKQEAFPEPSAMPNAMEIDDETKVVVPPCPIPPLWPSALNPKNAPYVVKIAKDNIIRFTGKGNHAHDVGTVRANYCLPSDCAIYYFEVTILDAGFSKTITIGLVPDDFILTRQIGTTATSYGYRGEDGRKLCGTPQSRGQVYGPMYVTGDVVGCGVNFYTNQIFFTKNGKDLGVAWTVAIDASQYYPAVSLHSPGESVKFNFGAEHFKFKIDALRTQEKERVESLVESTEVERSLLLNLVRLYMVHYGYEESVKALDTYGGLTDKEEKASPKDNKDDDKREKKENKENKENKDQKIEIKQTEKDPAYASLHNRKMIRELIQNGQISAAISTIDKLYPTLFKTKVDILFRLHCQQFISLLQEGKEKEAIIFARETLSTYSNSENAPALCTTLGLLAYSDASTSPLSYLLDRRHREEIADVVNGAILQLDGLPLSSSLEVAIRQLLTVGAISQEQNHNVGLPLAENLLA